MGYPSTALGVLMMQCKNLTMLSNIIRRRNNTLLGELPRDIYQRNILDLNISLAMIQLGSPNSLISLINAIESLETNQMKEYLTDPIKERLRFAKSFIKN